jgi:hypothetical protein
LQSCAVGAEARSGGDANGPHALIGIVGGSPQPYNYSASRSYQATTGHR